MSADTSPTSELLLTDAESYFDQVVKERRWTGRKTYGGGLEHTDPRYAWTRMAMEEALDLGQYLAARCRQLEDELAAERARVNQLLAQVRQLLIRPVE